MKTKTHYLPINFRQGPLLCGLPKKRKRFSFRQHDFLSFTSDPWKVTCKKCFKKLSPFFELKVGDKLVNVNKNSPLFGHVCRVTAPSSPYNSCTTIQYDKGLEPIHYSPEHMFKELKKLFMEERVVSNVKTVVTKKRIFALCDSNVCGRPRIDTFDSISSMAAYLKESCALTSAQVKATLRGNKSYGFEVFDMTPVKIESYTYHTHHTESLEVKE